MQNYASLQETHEEEPSFLLHISEPTRSRWNHIEDLDSFFTRVYKYHQRHGFACLLLREVIALHQYTFVVCLSVYLVYGVDYGVLMRHQIDKRISLDEVVLPISECIKQFSYFAWMMITLASIMFFFKIIRKGYNMILYWDIKQFYNTALNIQDKELDNLTWFEVQNKLKKAQLELQMCIHKRELTELDIYHRILRQENYLVAMVNKKLLPPRYDLPVLGEMVYWTEGLKNNVIALLFWSPWSPFENPWHLREEYKRQALRQELAVKLKRQIFWLAILNIIFSPIILVWQTVFYFFTYFDMMRREPGSFGIRFWSLYARFYLRHFNELEHELHSRLSKAYRPATKYLAAFSSPVANIVAEHVIFLCSSIFAVFVIVGLYDNDLLQIEYVFTIMACLTALIAISKSMIPDPTIVWCPDSLLSAVILHTHYLPGVWQNQAHTASIRASFQQLFQYRFAALLEELLSPIMTPYFLLKYLYPRSLEIVDFFRNFSVSVVGVGDVCSFAQMDIRKHGDPIYQQGSVTGSLGAAADQYTQCEDGKIELSLMHFTNTNPEWQPPEEAQDFVDSVQQEHEGNNELTRINSLIAGNIMDSSSLMDLDAENAMAIRFGDRKFSSVYRAEGPDFFSSSRNMRQSTMILHNRRANASRIVRSAEESTPLLSLQK